MIHNNNSAATRKQRSNCVLFNRLFCTVLWPICVKQRFSLSSALRCLLLLLPILVRQVPILVPVPVSLVFLLLFS